MNPNDPDSPTLLDYYKSMVTGSLAREAGEITGKYAITLGTIAFPNPGDAPVMPSFTDYDSIEAFTEAMNAWNAAMQAIGEKAWPYYNYEIKMVPETVYYEIVEKAGEKAEDGSTIFDKDITAEDAKAGTNVSALFDNASKDTTGKAVITVGKDENAATVTFDAAAVAAIAGKNVSFKMEISDAAAVADAPKGAVKVFDISLEGATFENGKATVKVPFAEKVPAGKTVKVYYVDADGNKTDMKATYKDGNIEFDTNHFSRYIVTYELSTGAIAGIAVACAVFAAAVVVAVIFILKKKGGKKGSDTTTTAAVEAEPAAAEVETEAAAE